MISRSRITFENRCQCIDKKIFHTHSERMRRVFDSSGPLLCLWLPPPLGWTDKVPSGMRILSRPAGRTPDICPGRSDFSPASSPIWGIPRWKASLGFSLYTSWQVTGPDPRFHRLLCLLEWSPPQQQRVAIPAQDSWRTTEVPCMHKDNSVHRLRLACVRSVGSVLRLW